MDSPEHEPGYRISSRQQSFVRQPCHHQFPLVAETHKIKSKIIAEAIKVKEQDSAWGL